MGKIGTKVISGDVDDGLADGGDCISNGCFIIVQGFLGTALDRLCGKEGLQ